MPNCFTIPGSIKVNFNYACSYTLIIALIIKHRLGILRTPAREREGEGKEGRRGEKEERRREGRRGELKELMGVKKERVMRNNPRDRHMKRSIDKSQIQRARAKSEPVKSPVHQPLS